MNTVPATAYLRINIFPTRLSYKHMDTSGGAIAGEYTLHKFFDQMWENSNKGVRFLPNTPSPSLSLHNPPTPFSFSFLHPPSLSLPFLDICMHSVRTYREVLGEGEDMIQREGVCG